MPTHPRATFRSFASQPRCLSSSPNLFRDNGSSWDSVEGTGTPADHDHTAGGDGGVLTNDQHDGYSDWTEIAAPASPGANVARLYAADDGGATKLYYKDSAGTVYELPTIVTGGGGSGAPADASYITTSASDCDMLVRKASVTVGPRVLSTPCDSKSAMTSCSLRSRTPFANSDPCGPMPNARSSMYTPMAAMNAPAA